MAAPQTTLPTSAYQTLKPGEKYPPIISPSQNIPELTPRSVIWGIALCVLFTVASAYSGLKVGQVMESAIPISILAIGLARAYSRRSTILENVIMTGIGGVAGSVVAGAIFTLPALYILKLDPHPMQTVFICLAGGCMGVLFVIPLRRYFVRDMHGLLPYPEATAITEVLVTGEKGGSQARLLLEATAISGVYDFFVTTFSVWKEYVNFQFVPIMQKLNDKARMVVSFDAISFILGLGYVIGLRSSMILCAGGMLSNLVLVPLIWYVGSHLDSAVYPALIPISKMTAVQIYRNYVRFIGVGTIATAGIFGIIKSLRIVASSFGIALKVFQRSESVAQPERTDRDISMVTIVLGIVASGIGVAVFMGFLKPSWLVVMIGMLLTVVFSFFFTSVAANAIATTARNPVSGMTMLTIIISSAVLLQFGLSGTIGMFFVMAIAGMVCTALSVSGQAITDFKAGYWIGSTPSAQEKVKFFGVIAAAIAASLTIVMLARGFQFGEAALGDLRPVLPSPQASIMKALVEGLMSHQPVAYMLFGVGAVIAVILEMLGMPSLLFALGMYLPLELNTPALVGGMISHFVNKRAEKTGGDAGRSVRERGVIIASGLMAGGALGGVLGAALRLLPKYREDLIHTPFFNNEPVSQTVSAVLFIGLCLYMWFRSLRKEAE
ncbi:Oligopeptide transporter, OPT [Candidatus Koribacter versatilis Ellin345]|uniref:Oligopeptide transporter, OPT n=1 Tax=Koribacter versatilis (strain Ellin345) TaxID=204669 RepID=Q1INW4_KORVE|nr:oligopeptide transporter, OPT family [Candidatus Koribacter versatilis]ABF41436.1 Oligopeptide transporter, OPT [Candidatus Koribacter versatilis Ellin345]